MEAIERMSYEFCEYQAKEGVIYAEARYCPHLLMPHIIGDSKVDFLEKTNMVADGSPQISPELIVKAVNQGLEKGQKDFPIIVRTILSCIRGKPEWSQEILDLCIQFKGSGVVGIDIAGDEGGEAVIEEEEKGLITIFFISCFKLYTFSQC